MQQNQIIENLVIKNEQENAQESNGDELKEDIVQDDCLDISQEFSVSMSLKRNFAEINSMYNSNHDKNQQNQDITVQGRNV